MPNMLNQLLHRISCTQHNPFTNTLIKCGLIDSYNNNIYNTIPQHSRKQSTQSIQAENTTGNTPRHPSESKSYSRRSKPTINITHKYNQSYQPLSNQLDVINDTINTRLPSELGGKRSVYYTGMVFSSKANKTITVQVDRYRHIKKYNKLFRSTKKFLTHDEYEEANEGML